MNRICPTLFPVILLVAPLDRDRRRKAKVEALSRWARRALAQSCVRSGLRLDALPKTQAGAPLPVGGVYWSLSHKTDIAGGVAADRPIGLDLETLRPVRDALTRKIADDAEWQLIGGRDVEAFFRFWTAKEAVLKAVGVGIAGLSRCRVVEVPDHRRMILSFDGHRWPVEQVRFGGHVAAVTAHRLEVVWTIHPPSAA